jgi:hypothetical protein
MFRPQMLWFAHEVPLRLRCVLHRPFNLVTDAGHAQRQAGRDPLRPFGSGIAL